MRTVTPVSFSHRVDIGVPNAIIAAQNAAKQQGIQLYQLNDSNPTHHGLAPAGLPPRYDAEPRGPRKAREALAAFLRTRSDGARSGGTQKAAEQQSEVTSGDLYVTSSTSQAYSWLMKLLCDPGDAVLCPTPGYPLIDSIGRLEAVEAVTYPLRYDGSWTIDVSAVEESLRLSAAGEIAAIKAIILINPNNPTGSYVGADDYEHLVEFCEHYGIAIIADEVFFDFSLRPLREPHRIAGEARVLTFGLDGFSKMLAAPHAKVGWIQVSGPEPDVAAAQKRLDVIADDFLPMSGIISELIPELLTSVPEQLHAISTRTRANLETLDNLLNASDSGVVSLLRPEGGWNVLLRFPSVVDENDLVQHMIAVRAVTAQPGYFFDMVSNGYVAVSLLPEPADFARGISVLLSSIDDMLG